MDAEGEMVWEIYKDVLLLTDEKFDSLCKTLYDLNNQYVNSFILSAKERRKSIY